LYRARLSRDRVRVKTRLRALLAKHGVTVSARDILGRKVRRVLAAVEPPPAAAGVLAGYLRVADALTAELRESTTRIETVVARDAQPQLLMSLPGLGAFGALLLSATIGPIARFPTPKHLGSYLGLAPSVHSSGGHTRYGALTKQDDPDARWMLIEAATHAMRHQPFARLYQRVKARQGTPAARVAVARRLVISSTAS
jgi:transposase